MGDGGDARSEVGVEGEKPIHIGTWQKTARGERNLIELQNSVSILSITLGG